ncbi:GIN domain-containing protein [Chryseolinea lacunae]|uniref:DUF2807 domain-containing protein n=1 Tax=Chryseolinea lacunae TaxID=2801331 RepID=A0ABS1L2G5_9BACT|nr:DUF2807 domain-containing protein [Chryseolinea lacunae]MBL0745707.1 DUF2807 domain-containing protein [Chryseolinea lacunae]
METVLPYVTDLQLSLIQETVSKIVHAVQPEKIICYGLRSNSRQRWSSFQQERSGVIETSIDLLIVTNEKDKRNRDGVLNILDNLRTDQLDLIAVVHSIDAVNCGLKEGNPFFTNLYYNGVLLFDQSQTPFETPQNTKELLTDERQLALAQSFYETGCNCATEERNEVAAFMFHQSVEQSCAALLKSCLGYRPTTHSIKRLFSLVENITPEVKSLFPSSTDQEADLLEILHRAYSDVRYKDGYEVTANNVFALMERVSALHDLVKELCTNRNAGNIPANDTDLEKFDTIVIDVPFDIILYRGSTENIRIETSKKGESKITYAVQNQRLRLSVRNNTGDPIPYAIVHVTYTALTGLVIDGSGRVSCTDFIESEFLGIVQNGKGEIDLKVNVSTLDATVTKIGSLKISGTAACAKILNTGPGNFVGSDLETSEARLTIKDSGSVSIHVEDQLSAFLHGSGKLLLKGKPRIKEFVMDV